MSDQQLSDWRLGVKLVAGTRVKYIGPSRDEKAENGLFVPRENGQLGVIVHTEQTPSGKVLTFRPLEPVLARDAKDGDKRHFVDLQVREGTAGWLMLERVP